jgi:hypothetical protein
VAGPCGTFTRFPILPDLGAPEPYITNPKNDLVEEQTYHVTSCRVNKDHEARKIDKVLREA